MPRRANAGGRRVGGADSAAGLGKFPISHRQVTTRNLDLRNHLQPLALETMAEAPERDDHSDVIEFPSRAQRWVINRA